jgi:hypothetical protein
MERMILHRFSHFLESNNLLSSSQHRFRRGRSTMEALASLGDAIATAFEKRNMVAAVFFDFTRAFGTVLPSYVLDCLISIGIHDRLLQYSHLISFPVSIPSIAKGYAWPSELLKPAPSPAF